LIVAINSDNSLQKLKGENRPLIDEKGRAFIVASLEFVDYVLIFNQLNVEKILFELKPHIHAKGSDYSVENVPEKNLSESLGIKTKITGGPKIRSTSDIINKIKKIYEKNNNNKT